MRYMIWDREVGVVVACKLCKSIEQFKELKARAKQSAGSEYSVYVGGKTLTFIK